ncbi:class I SAM-dependent methyltransferase [Azospirillum picis]|uniref:SAM-dependent methyltransferase n=1 Tax=Azospirillum picis TaxID=488438 RepID=A0ABU0MJY8_9PROT|nr:methyltransferase domain-containing protein [Azospirillum picis]MBP2300002.1 SAM-dependent methyltransferase [Azospirillum picis]MDQ0533760.1 SAM-dependent methyltransferase [Azospirillum picis]
MPSTPCQPSPPSSWVQRFAPLVRPGGPVLDVACGGGRHLRLFHGRGHPVVGLDRDLGGVGDLDGRDGVTLVRVDLEAPVEAGGPVPLGTLPPGRRFAGIVVTNYLHRPLFPAILAALEPGGVLIYETFADGNARFGRPSSPDFLLRRGELLEAVRGRLQVVAFEQGEVAVPKPAVVQRLCAVAGEEPVALAG